MASSGARLIKSAGAIGRRGDPEFQRLEFGGSQRRAAENQRRGLGQIRARKCHFNRAAALHTGREQRVQARGGQLAVRHAAANEQENDQTPDFGGGTPGSGGFPPPTKRNRKR